MIINKKILTLTVILSLVIGPLISITPAQAASTRLYVDAPSNVKVGEKFTVRVMTDAVANGGNRLKVDLIYPVDIVSALSANTTNSVFGGNSYPNNHYGSGQGRITHLAFPIPAPNGDNLLVFSAEFSAKKTGSANYSFSADSVVNDSIPSKVTSTINISQASCPSGQTGTPPNCSSPPRNPTPQNPPNQTPRPSPPPTNNENNNPRPSPRPNSTPIQNTQRHPAQVYPGRVVHPALPTTPLEQESPAPPSNPEISSPDIVNQQVLDSKLDIVTLRTATRLNRAELIVELNHPSDVTIKYGTSADALNKDAKLTRESDSRFYTDIRDLNIGETYYYTINGERTDGSEKMTQSGTFSTKGYGVEITALQQDGNPLANAQISFENTGGSISTNEKGIAYVQVKDGEYTVNVSKGGHSSTHKITVERKPIDEDGDAGVQEIELKTSATSTTASATPERDGPSVVAYIITVMIGVIIVTVIGFVIYLRRRASENKRSSQGVVVIDDGWTPPPR